MTNTDTFVSTTAEANVEETMARVQELVSQLTELGIIQPQPHDGDIAQVIKERDLLAQALWVCYGMVGGGTEPGPQDMINGKGYDGFTTEIVNAVSEYVEESVDEERPEPTTSGIDASLLREIRLELALSGDSEKLAISQNIARALGES